MSEATETTITPEMIDAYNRRQAAAEEQRRQETIRDLMRLARERGYEIVAAPHIQEGLLVAVWGVRATT